MKLLTIQMSNRNTTNHVILGFNVIRLLAFISIILWFWESKSQGCFLNSTEYYISNSCFLSNNTLEIEFIDETLTSSPPKMIFTDIIDYHFESSRILLTSRVSSDLPKMYKFQILSLKGWNLHNYLDWITTSDFEYNFEFKKNKEIKTTEDVMQSLMLSDFDTDGIKNVRFARLLQEDSILVVVSKQDGTDDMLIFENLISEKGKIISKRKGNIQLKAINVEIGKIWGIQVFTQK